MRWRLVVLMSIGGSATALAQTPPGTDVYLSAVRFAGGRPSFAAPKNLTARPGYDNQPAFTPDGRTLLYTSVRPGGPGGSTQADIHRIELAGGSARPVTATPESEYSATVLASGREISVIRVEPDSTQRLWAFSLDGAAPPRLLLERVKPVGYQAWLDPSTVGVFVLGSPATLQVADLATGKSRILLSGIGRAIHRIPGRRAISITQLVAENVWWIVEVDPVSAATRPIARMPEGAEYYIWLPDRSLLSAKGNSLYRLVPGRDTAWTAVHTFEGLGSISRLALSPKGDRLAFVVEDPR